MPQCDFCSVLHSSVELAPKMNCYDEAPPMVCPVCLDHYVDFWNEQWDEYYSSQGYPHRSEPSNAATEEDLIRYRVSNFSMELGDGFSIRKDEPVRCTARISVDPCL